MDWNDRLREAAYTSPSGKRFVFTYENVRKTVEKKTTGFEFPDADGTYVQESGRTGRRYPWRIFFWGSNHDIQADAFDAGLMERGIGKLEHPKYGVVDVIPFGAINQRDDLKTSANQSIIELVFWETIRLIYPTSQDDPASEVISAVDEYNDAAASEFADVLDLDTAIQRARLRNTITLLIGTARSKLQDIANTQDDVRQQFDAIVDSINEGIDVLVSEPITLGLQTIQAIQSPARAITSINARLDAYGSLINTIISTNDVEESNDFHTADLLATSEMTGSVLSVVNNQFVTKTDAIAAAEVILEQFDDLVVWRDDNFASLEEIDTGSSYQQLQEAVALTAGFLVEISFNLKQERRIVLDRDRTIIDLSAQLYGSVDDQLDFLISSNDLSGDEILELPRGREIVYYI